MNFAYGKDILCQNKLEIPGSKGMAFTYCMRPVNHKGPCATEKQPEDKKDANAGTNNK